MGNILISIYIFAVDNTRILLSEHIVQEKYCKNDLNCVCVCLSIHDNSRTILPNELPFGEYVMEPLLQELYSFSDKSADG